MMRVLDLFSGIGGFSLGLERAGMKTAAFCEIDPYCRRVLAKHWPDVPCHDDIATREFVEGEADVVCGGFPCQDISSAGARAGITGSRSGLWRELVRAIRVVRPLYAIVENVAALLNRGMGRVLGDLAEIGIDAEWHCIPASAVGAPHRRDRVWIVAYSAEPRRETLRICSDGAGAQHEVGVCGCTLANALGIGCNTWWGEPAGQQREIRAVRSGGAFPNSNGESAQRFAITWGECGHWLSEPDVGRVAHGVPARVDRLRSLGNAVVPQIPELIGRAILHHHERAA